MAIFLKCYFSYNAPASWGKMTAVEFLYFSDYGIFNSEIKSESNLAWKQLIEFDI